MIRATLNSAGLPRMRGDRPQYTTLLLVTWMFTPHARGSTPCLGCKRHAHHVYPACAGIDLFPLQKKRKKKVYPACAGIDLVGAVTFRFSISLPRMRGDRPLAGFYCMVSRRFTPHARGSTVIFCDRSTEGGVYPACAGIDLHSGQKKSCPSRLPRMRGDRPSRVKVEPRM